MISTFCLNFRRRTLLCNQARCNHVRTPFSNACGIEIVVSWLVLTITPHAVHMTFSIYDQISHPRIVSPHHMLEGKDVLVLCNGR